ncbi:MAG: glycosyltransferase 36 [Bryobacterales bacterium]|nr:glycosyltransferase 36 [Bryobacterales bacterium]
MIRGPHLPSRTKTSRRTVLAFFPAEEEQTAEVRRAAQSAGVRHVRLVRGGQPDSDAQPHAGLVLEGENLLLAEVPAGETLPLVQALRQVGHTAVFVLPDHVAQPCPDDVALESPNNKGWLSLRDSQALIEAAHTDLSEALGLGHTPAPAAAWFLDNAYLIRSHLREIRTDLPREYRRMISGAGTNLAKPRAYRLAQDLTQRTQGALSESSIVTCLNDFQVKEPLRIAELWSFPLFLRMAVIEHLAVLATSVACAQRCREAAQLWADRLTAAARRGTDEFNGMLARMESQEYVVVPHFLTVLAEQLQGEENAFASVQHWIEERLKQPLTEIVRAEHTREAAESVATAQAFGSLRLLSQLDFTKIFEAVSLVEAELRRDPAEVYAHSDFATRDRCRRTVEQIARSSGKEELEVAGLAIGLAAAAQDPSHRHVTHYLLADGVLQLEQTAGARPRLQTRLHRSIRRHATGVYLGGISLLTACFTAITAAVAHEAGITQPWVLAVLSALAVFPLSELSIQIVNALVISLFPPSILPKMNYKDGIPYDRATLVVVPMMLSSEAVVKGEIRKLEVRFLANPEVNLFYALFSDFTDAPEVAATGDTQLFNIARDGIAGLNARYPGERFLLFHRPRTWSDTQQSWIGRERKRGKIEELNDFLAGHHSGEILQLGRLPEQIRYVITLDADTQLPPGTARRMVETISHPLNEVSLDPHTRARRKGYSIIQPRVSVSLPAATATRFTHIMSDTAGTDPYCRAVSDVQQDLFGEGIFHGKAIYDVQAFRTIFSDRFPAETLLSHDLIEGAYAGVAMATDIELLETLPLDYSSFVRRQHRWIRGDWQIAPWMFSWVPAPGGAVRNPLSIIHRWRILDNLRRSLVPIASMLLLLFGWLISAAPAVSSVVVAVAVAIPALAPLIDRWARQLHGSVNGWRGAADELLRACVMIAFLPHQAWISADAIMRAWYRSNISRRHMLEWQTAEAAEVNLHHHSNTTRNQMLVVSGASLLLTGVLLAKGTFAPSSGFLVLWALSPLVLTWLSRPARAPASQQISLGQAVYLRRHARRTWRYFDDLVGPDTNWLPPDNSQLALRVEVARRTSPTNIGMWLSAALAARDFGYLTADELCHRCSATLATIQQLERYEGHLLNWYNTTTREPLSPRYVSSVDSGNLLASLWVLEQGCRDAVRAPLVGTESLRGLADSAAILSEVSGEDPSLSVPLRAIRRLLRGDVAQHEFIARLRMASHAATQLQEVRRWQTTPTDEPTYWASSLAREAASWTATVNRYLLWMETLSRPPNSFLQSLSEELVTLRRQALESIPSLSTLAEIGSPPTESILMRRGVPGLRPEAAAWLDQVDSEYRDARAHAAETLQNFEALAAAVHRFADGINMRFLYDKDRRLFAVGYVVGGPLEFTSHYDLLASESRLASLVAIAKKDVPVEHWFTLHRPRGAGPHWQTLLSWSGTMFEYLMPNLFMRTYQSSLLDQACRNAVARQIEYGREKDVPWGISEAAYSALDANQIYQYRAFGVPDLAIQPDLDEEPVVAPYATMLALMIDPHSAIPNLQRLENLGLDGPMGFYESIDFSRESKRDGSPGVVIYAYMAHHQGMSLVAMDNVLHHGAMQRRFHNDPRIRAVESLLFERIPITKPIRGEAQTRLAVPHVTPAEEAREVTFSKETPVPKVHLYGNGRYALMVSNSGAGYSRWNEFDLTRWRSDPTLDEWGSYLYLRDVRTGTAWAATPQPVNGALGKSSVTFSEDRADFNRSVLGIDTVMSVTVSPEDDVELRRLTIINRTVRSRLLEITSYAELALAPEAADAAHPAFSKIFVETMREEDVLVARRRLRSPDEPPVWVAHMLVGASGAVKLETDRAEFLGRGNTVHTPAALRQDLTGSQGAVLDPVFSIRCRETLDPRERRELIFLTMAAASREALMTLVARYRRKESTARAFELAWTHAQLQFRFLQIVHAAAQGYQELAGYLLYPNARMRPSPGRLTLNRLGQSALWTYGISGDLPIVTVTISDSFNLGLIRELLLAHTYWRLRGFHADLIIFNQEPPSYERPLHLQLQRQIDAYAREANANRAGGVFLLDWHMVPEEHRNLIFAASHAVLSGNRGSLQRQLAGTEALPPTRPFVPLAPQTEEPSSPLPFLELPYFNGLGGFTGDGREYAIYLAPDTVTPAPWINVMANAQFGTLVSESGLGFTWYGNSQQNRLTPWTNDPVSNPPPEVIYIRDDQSGARWTPTVSPIRERDAYRARHGQGYTVFEHNSHAIAQELTVFVPVGENGAGDPVKVCRLRLRNESSRRRHLSVTYFAEWVLGATREDQQLHVQTAFDQESGVLLARQSWRENYAGVVAFAAASPRASTYSGDRTQFLGRNRTRANPAALDTMTLDNRSGPGMDPAAALQVPAVIEPGQTVEIVFLLGQHTSVEAVRELVQRYSAADKVERALDATRKWWDEKLGSIQVRTPYLSTNFLLNRWLLYQSMCCRFWARSALYQSGGAFGFRDQLQDAMAYLYSAPELAHAHILAAASHQFIQGDVQHWWHPESGLGVRTRCSDDLLWLPYAAARYVEVTGDDSILDLEAPFLEGPVLEAHEQERMSIPVIAARGAPLWEHCIRAIEHAWQLGPHNIPLIGSGDWNDGLNRVGAEGRGESVWLGWFYLTVLKSCAALADQRDPERASMWRERAQNLASAIEQSCWDGEWYLRAFFDDGTPLGSRANQEARIDSLPQSWAALSGSADPARTLQAMKSATLELARKDDQLVLLFTPPFDHSQPHPGYIMGYPPGVRENGGQYTHGSLWLTMAWARLGDGERAVSLLQMMNPIERSRDPESAARYRGEPYVVAADVSSAPGKIGRAGWTWYTGSASWMYRVWIEEVLGFKLRGDLLHICPAIPQDWPGFEMVYKYRSSVYEISVKREDGFETRVELDGRLMDSSTIRLSNDGAKHRITVRLAPSEGPVRELIPAQQVADR